MQSTMENSNDGTSGMTIKRRFTTVGDNPFDTFEWITTDLEIRNMDGTVAHDMLGVCFPSGFEGVPGTVAAQKYLRKAGVPAALRPVPEDGVPTWLQRSAPDEEKLQKMENNQRYIAETDFRQMFRRLAGTWTYWGWKYGYFASEEDARSYYDEMCFLIASQRSAPNSPQWFNTGLHWAYGIEGNPQGHMFVNPDTGMMTESSNSYEHPQPHACFIQSVSDSLVGGSESIMGLWEREALLFKFGSGTGSNFSNIRGKDEPLSGGGRSSGLLSFLKIGDRAAGAIKSGGTTRRAAKMVTLDLDHPDIEEYINWKASEEEKVSSLIIGSQLLQKHAKSIMSAMWADEAETASSDMNTNPELKNALVNAVKDGVPEPHIKRIMDLGDQGWRSVNFEVFDSDWQGEGYITVSGQNSNNSVRVPNNFMDAVEAGDDWNLYWRTELTSAEEEGRSPEPCKTLPARDLWDQIAYTAWACADPGVQYDSTINEWHTCPEGGRINGSNPCSEYMFLDDTACNLASINLLEYYDANTRTFQIEDFQHSVRLWTTTLEISVLMAQFPSEEIAQKSYEYRTLGLGYCNLGSLLMHMGIPYDDDRARAICGALTAIMCGESYATSAEMASFLGPFEKYGENRDHMLRVIQNHRRAAYDVESKEYDSLSVKPLGIDAELCPDDLLDAARDTWDRALNLGTEFGFRNAQTTVIAPTGTIGLVMACDTTGVEPSFSLVQFKSLAGGGMLKIINNGVKLALSELGYDNSQIEEMETYVMGSKSIEGCPSISRERLTKAGFGEAEFAKIEDSIGAAYDIRGAFNVHTLGSDFCTDVLGMKEEQIDNPFFDVLKHIGFSVSEIDDANDYVFGRMTIEGAPHLNEEHLAVFDCATPCGKYGERSIAWPAHVRMMAAAQPFISGAISKTVNLPSSATIDDIREVYNLSHSTMNKATAVYRDQSKLSQPLMNKLVDTSSLEEETLNDSTTITTENAVKQVVESLPLPAEQAMPLAKAYVQNYIATRRPLPDVRESKTMKARVGGHTVYLSSSMYEDGRLGEIMLTTSKEGMAWRSLLNQFAIAVSIGLQYGVPLDAFVKSFTFQKFEPSGMVSGGSGRVKMATSIVDYIFRELAINHLNRDDLSHVLAEDLDSTSISRPEHTPDGIARNIGHQRNIQTTLDVDMMDTPPIHDQENESSEVPLKAEVESDLPYSVAESARAMGFTGDICTTCGSSQMVRNGTCLKCNECGETTGCS